MLARSGLVGKNSSRPHLGQFQEFVPWAGKTQKMREFCPFSMGPIHPVWGNGCNISSAIRIYIREPRPRKIKLFAKAFRHPILSLRCAGTMTTTYSEYIPQQRYLLLHWRTKGMLSRCARFPSLHQILVRFAIHRTKCCACKLEYCLHCRLDTSLFRQICSPPILIWLWALEFCGLSSQRMCEHSQTQQMI